MNVVSRFLLGAAAASMTVLPVAAQAGTRASDSSATYSVSAPGKGRDQKGESVFGLALIPSLLVVGSVFATVIVSTVIIQQGRTPGAR
jgi:hypothetical protein